MRDKVTSQSMLDFFDCATAHQMQQAVRLQTALFRRCCLQGRQTGLLPLQM